MIKVTLGNTIDPDGQIDLYHDESTFNQLFDQKLKPDFKLFELIKMALKLIEKFKID